MKWQKRGLIYGPDGSSAWAANSALQPTAVVLNDEVIRVYCGFRDASGVGRAGYVDIDGHNPSRVVAVSADPVLDVGRPGTFDENGVIPCAVVRRDGRFYMYYAGYQLGHKVRFLVLGGLAVSADGTKFERVHEVPVTERTDDELYFRVIHCIFEDQGRWRTWYGGGREFVRDGERTLPVYDIRYMESPDGFTFPFTGSAVLTLATDDEHRVGRPQVIKTGDLYRMFYAAGSIRHGYRLGYAESADGFNWTRKDAELGIDVSADGWDSQMIAYPNPVQFGDRFYLFYNGNEYGRAGFGYAELESW
jgi:predicted GH43/DUF377 family glycosyl hydrolase